MIPVLDGEAVRSAVSPADAIDATKRAFLAFHEGRWEMPPKTYVDAPPDGDFRAMPARGDGFACLKWVTSFPGNPERGLPVVTGALLLSSAETGELLALIDCASVTALRTGAAAVVSAWALARSDAARVGIVGCGVNGAAAARCFAAAGYSAGVCSDVDPERAGALAEELGWQTGGREEAVACEVVATVTPGSEAVIGPDDVRPGGHIAALGADAAGKNETHPDALSRCRLFCDDWKQASTGGELAAAVAAGRVKRSAVTEIGAVLDGEQRGRRSGSETTLFDSTGLAIQDLALAIEAYESWRRGEVEATEVALQN